MGEVRGSVGYSTLEGPILQGNTMAMRKVRGSVECSTLEGPILQGTKWQCGKSGAVWNTAASLRWRHNEQYEVSNHQPHDCLLKRLFRRRSKKTSKLCVTGLCEGNSLGTWIPCTKVQWRVKCFHLMTSSCGGAHSTMEYYGNGGSQGQCGMQHLGGAHSTMECNGNVGSLGQCGMQHLGGAHSTMEYNGNVGSLGQCGMQHLGGAHSTMEYNGNVGSLGQCGIQHLGGVHSTMEYNYNGGSEGQWEI